MFSVPTIRSFLKNNYLLIFIIIFYFGFYLINLTLLPIFNDESIYLNWGWLQIHWPGHLYDSVYDAKQPLMIWIFGIFETFFRDPLFAGRFVAIIFGFFTLLGIYKTTEALFDKKTALIASLVYSITPIFVFYNRQALLEAGIICFGVWAFYFLLKLIKKPDTRNAIFLGIILGIGFFIKSTMLIFILSSFLVVCWHIYKSKKTEIVKPILIALGVFLATDALLFINPVFWQTFSSNSRYSLTFSELIRLPISTWVNNIFGFLEIGLIFFTPLFLIAGIAGIFMMIKKKVKNRDFFLIYFISALFLQLFTVKSQNQRYLVAFLPFLIISASYVLDYLFKGQFWKRTAGISFFIIPAVLSLFIIFNPNYYISWLSKFTKQSEVAYIYGQTSGYGINEVMGYLEKKSEPGKPTLVFFGLNAGNPEDAVNLYAMKSETLLTFRMDSKLYQGLDDYPCMKSDYPAFLITRFDQLLGMEKYFTLAKSVKNPDGKYFIGIYTLKKDCKGKVVSVSDVYKEPMNEELQIRGMSPF